MKRTSKNFAFLLLVIGITVFIATIIIYIMSHQTINDFDYFYKQQHTQFLDELSKESMSKGDMAGVVIAEIGVHFSVSLNLMLSNFITILFGVVLICLGGLLWHSSKPIKGFTIIIIILSIILLGSLFVLEWTDNIFLQYINYLFATPSLINTIAAIAIIVVSLLTLIMFAKSIHMLIRLKRKT